MKKIISLFLFIAFFQSVHTKNITQISMPKAGTHLLSKCISLLRNNSHYKADIALDSYPSSFYCIEPERFDYKSQTVGHWANHLFFNEGFEPFLSNNNCAFFFIYRDPRDQVVSFAHYMLVRDYWKQKVAGLSFDDLLLSLIESGDTYDNHPPCQNIDDLYRRYIPWLSMPSVCVIRFEDLIGPRGGSSLDAQLDAIRKIANHLDIDVADEALQEVAQKLFGGTSTFRKGQIGDWRNHFKSQHEVAFKKIAGQLLIDLGYEEDMNW